MNDNIEIAKIAAQLTIAILNDKNGGSGQAAYFAKTTGDTDSKKPDALKIFDFVYKHVQSTLTEQ